ARIHTVERASAHRLQHVAAQSFHRCLLRPHGARIVLPGGGLGVGDAEIGLHVGEFRFGHGRRGHHHGAHAAVPHAAHHAAAAHHAGSHHAGSHRAGALAHHAALTHHAGPHHAALTHHG